MAKWRTNGLPKSKLREESEEVLVTWIPNWNKNSKLVSTAVYIEDHNVTTEDIYWPDDYREDLEYCKELDAYWLPGGWYETIINSIDGVEFIAIDGEVIAWQKKPKAYIPPVL